MSAESQGNGPDSLGILVVLGSLVLTPCTYADGEDAFEKMLLHRPDLLLSDVMMPRLDGFGLLKKVRASAALRDRFPNAVPSTDCSCSAK